jgi:RNA polymerase sigma-70 factor, ECF subfamily
MEQTDERLMAAYAAGDHSALETLFNRYAAILLRVLQRQVTFAQAEDLVQQTFLQVHRARHDFDPAQRFRPWLFTIALNLRREHQRRQGRRPETLVEELPESTDAAWPEAQADAARDLDWALSALPFEQREVIELHWLEGLSFREIAQAMSLSRAAALARAHRGYVHLRHLLLGQAESPVLPGAPAVKGAGRP